MSVRPDRPRRAAGPQFDAPGPRRPRRWLRTLAASLPLVALLSGGCSFTGRSSGHAEARTTAELLAARLEHHTLSGVPLVSPTSEALFADRIRSMAAGEAHVRVENVTTDGDAATAKLGWSWHLGGHAWAYDTDVALVRTQSGWKVDWRSPALAPGLTDADRLAVVRVQPQRAPILGAHGEPIVTQRPVVRFGLDKSAIKPSQVRASARRIAHAVGINAARFVRAAERSGSSAFVEAITLRVDEAAATVRTGFGAIPGALALHTTEPLAPSRDFASQLLGRVGPATAESIASSDGRVQAGDQVGLSGLQARYDAQLAGTPRIEVRAVRVTACPTWPTCAETGEYSVLKRWGGRSGTPLRLTIDLGMQAKAEKILASSGNHSTTALVAIRPSSGEILAAANGPSRDGVNAATYGHYPPGSTFKVVTSLALLRRGLSPDTLLDCPATIEVNGYRFKNYNDYPPSKLGRVTFRTALANSCNTAFIGQRDRLTGRDLARAAASLGLGVDHDLGFPAYFGQVPEARGQTEKAADMIGQGSVLASPLAMATVAASVAAGHTVVPHLFSNADGTSAAVVSTPSDGPSDATDSPALTWAEADKLRDLMRAVVAEGPGRFLLDLPGRVGAKTGTAEYGSGEDRKSLPTHAWMIATQGDLAVAVFVETGDSGSGAAGPLLHEFLAR